MDLERYVRADTSTPEGWCKPVWEHYEELIALLVLLGCEYTPGEAMSFVSIDACLATQLGLEACNLVLHMACNEDDNAVNLRRLKAFVDYLQEKPHETDQSPVSVS